MTLDEEVTLEPHDPKWAESYETEGLKLLEAFGDSVREIEHIGSTAVAGLVANPIIDVMVGVDSLEAVSHHVVSLQQIGYEYMGEAGVEERFFFRKRDGQAFDVSVVVYQGERWRRNLLFRDYLREHPEEAERYGELKQRIVEENGIDRSAEYSARKSAFIDEVIERAES